MIWYYYHKFSILLKLYIRCWPRMHDYHAIMLIDMDIEQRMSLYAAFMICIQEKRCYYENGSLINESVFLYVL